MSACMCGCGRTADRKHHVVYRDKLSRVASDDAGRGGRQIPPYKALIKDRRNLLKVASSCERAHHAGSVVYPLSCLPDSVFEFAAEVLGPTAFAYLRGRYSGEDSRLEALTDGCLQQTHPSSCVVT